jgi:mannitol-specific phosphotransferase system IIBC component
VSKNTVFFMLGGIPLLLYPFVLLADIMSIAGERTGNENVFLIIIVGLFLFLSSSYPISYSVCLVLYLKNKNRCIWAPIFPLIHVVVVVLVGYLWAFLEKQLS